MKIGGFTMRSLEINEAQIPDYFDRALREAAPLMLEALKNLENDSGQIPDHAWDLCQKAIAAAGGDTK